VFCGWLLELVAEFAETFVSNWGTGSETAAIDESLIEVEGKEEEEEDVTDSSCRLFDCLIISTPAMSSRASLGALVVEGRLVNGFKPASVDRGGDNTVAEATLSSILSGDDDDDAAAEDDKLSPPLSPLLLLSLLIIVPSAAAEVVVDEFDFFGRIAGVFAPAVVPSSWSASFSSLALTNGSSNISSASYRSSGFFDSIALTRFLMSSV